MKLSIIIPCYNAEKYLPDLLECLNGQIMKMGYNSDLTDKEVEVFLIDDGSKVPVKADYPWTQVFRKANEGPGIARNVGLDHMTGDYFTFIDADDMVTDYYLQTIFDKIDSEAFDYCYLSWKTMPGGWNCTVQLKSVNDKFPGFNLCVWNRVYKTATFGKHRFDPKKLWSEDADFIYRLNEHGKKSFISDIMYYYRSDTPDSWTKKMFGGELDYTRIVYNLKEIKADNTKLLEEIKREYVDNEIVLLTNNNEIPELEHYCMIMKYNTPCKGTILRGDKYPNFMPIERPIKTQVLIWTDFTQTIGGIETWIYNFCKVMRKYYDITVLYNTIHYKQLARLQQMVQCIKKSNKKIICDTCIVSRITDKVPDNVRAGQVVQMVHACKMLPQWAIPQDHDYIIGVSQAVLDSFNEQKGQVIYNMVDKPTDKKCLLLVSATRLSKTSAFEKGHNRMLKLADMLNEADIPYMWLLFSDAKWPEAKENMIVLPPTMDIAPFLAKADYYVSLSDAEGYGYSMVESLINGTPVITTPITVLPELGIEDGKNGYVVPFDMNFDVTKLLDIPQFKYKRTNTESVKKWRTILGDTTPTHSYIPTEGVSVQVIRQYKDLQFDRLLPIGEIIIVDEDRANALVNAGYGRRI